MARGEYPNDFDQNFQIEAGLVEPLRRGETAEIDTSAIEKGYTLLEELDHGEEIAGGTTDEKCVQLVKLLHNKFAMDTDYVIKGDTIQFRRKKPR